MKHELVEILKHPLCIGKVRSAVLKTLEKITGGQFHDEYGLRLMTAENTPSIPSEGERLVIIAKVKDQLHFRIFNAEGKQVVKESEEDNIPDAKLESLKRQLHDFWEPAGMPKDPIVKALIVETVASLLRHTLDLEYDYWKFVEQAGELGLDVTTPPKRPGDTT